MPAFHPHTTPPSWGQPNIIAPALISAPRSKAETAPGWACIHRVPGQANSPSIRVYTRLTHHATSSRAFRPRPRQSGRAVARHRRACGRGGSGAPFRTCLGTGRSCSRCRSAAASGCRVSPRRALIPCRWKKLSLRKKARADLAGPRRQHRGQPAYSGRLQRPPRRRASRAQRRTSTRKRGGLAGCLCRASCPAALRESIPPPVRPECAETGAPPASPGCALAGRLYSWRRCWTAHG